MICPYLPCPVESPWDAVVGALTLPTSVSGPSLDEVRLHASQTAIGEWRILGVNGVGVAGRMQSSATGLRGALC